METTFKLHENLQLLRKQKGITQEELANHFNITNQSVSKWENGQSYPDITLLPKLAAFFNVSIDELLNYSPPSSTESLYLQIRTLFESLPREEVYKTAFKLSALMHDKDTLAVLFTLHKQTHESGDKWSLIDDIIKDTKLALEKVVIVIDKLTIENIIDEKFIDEVARYRVSGPFSCILPILSILASGSTF